MRPRNKTNNVDRLRMIAQEIRKREELTASLKTARREQQHMLPQPPEIKGYEFATVYLPAGEIGGDFYDFIEAPDGLHRMIMGDVTGHGIEAAIIMGMAKKTLAIYNRSKPDLYQAITATNSELYGDLLPSRFVSVSILSLDVMTHTIEFARAGHNPLILFNPKRPNPYQEIAPRGTVVGIFKPEAFNATLKITKIQLYAGDFVLLYTDGLTEARNQMGAEFEMKGIRSVVESNPDASAGEIIAAMIESVRDFTGSDAFDDDVTLVAFKVKG